MIIVDRQFRNKSLDNNDILRPSCQICHSITRPSSHRAWPVKISNKQRLHGNNCRSTISAQVAHQVVVFEDFSIIGRGAS